MSSSSYEVTGKIVAIYDIVQRTQTFRTREFAIEKTDMIGDREITNYIKFQTVNDRTQILDRVKVGDNVKVLFNLRGSKWMKDGRENYITNLDAWRIEAALTPGVVADAEAPAFTPDQIPSADNAPDDLPF